MESLNPSYNYDTADHVCDYTKEERVRRHHTYRRQLSHFDPDIMVSVKRPDVKGGVYVTPIDGIIEPVFDGFRYNFSNKYHDKFDYSLRKSGKFDTFFSMIEELAVSKHDVFDRRFNQMSTVFTVPCIDFVTFKSKSPKYSRTDHFVPRQRKERFIQYGRNTYSNIHTYMRSEGDLVKLNIPPAYYSDIKLHEDHEQLFVAHKTIRKDDMIHIVYHHDLTVNSIILRPEKLIFEMVHGDKMCHTRCRKSKHYLKILKNDPGYVTRFNLYYRSEAGGVWIHHGTHVGCLNMFMPVKIEFDTIVAKELRLVPVEWVGSFDKVSFNAVGPAVTTHIDSKEQHVTYTIFSSTAGQTKQRDNFLYTSKRRFKNKEKTAEKDYVRRHIKESLYD